MTVNNQQKLISLDRKIDHSYDTLSKEDLAIYRDLVTEFVCDFSGRDIPRHLPETCCCSCN